MSLLPGTRVGQYEVLEAIGAGGMGEVYRATDTRLKRQVAFKVLPSSVTADPDRLARFQREAEVLASLNHPNIAGLHGIEESDGVKALVLELVEGPTLADRIAEGPVPLADALPIARQIAEALAAAHDQGIIHRDLKPANIKLRPDGEVKVLDFGLAKAMTVDEPKGSSLQLTVTSPAMTMQGVILGTAAYMSPEQAAGRPVDRRTDLWAFGVVLMEMLTGRKVFAGDSVSDVLASVLKDEPDWAALPEATPSSIRRLLRRCLERDRKQRWPDAAAARIECDDALAAGAATATAGAGSVSVVRSPWALAAALFAGVMIGGGIAWTRWPQPAPAADSIRFAIDLPADRQFTRAGRHVLALSPDGLQLAYAANRQLFVHDFRGLETRAVEGTFNTDPSEPVFSPDGAWLAFWSNGALMKIPIGGGSAVKLAVAANPLGLSWSGDQIVAGQPRSVLQVSADGSASKVLLTIDKPSGEWVQSPQLVDEGRAVIFTLRTNEQDWNSADIVVQDLATGQRATVVTGATDGRALPGGMLIYARDTSMFAVAFDERRRVTTGETVALERNVMPSVGGFSGASQFATSASGDLAFALDGSTALSGVVWMSRQGKTEPTTFPPQPYFPAPNTIALSPDGKRFAARIAGVTRSQTDVWIGDTTRGTFSRLTSTGNGTDPVWTPDGSSVCYRTSPNAVLCQPFDGSAAPRSLFELDALSTISDISRDGTQMLLNVSAATGFDIWAVANRPPYAPKPLLATPFNENGATLSPDGRWIAYTSSEGGRDDVYVRPFPNVGDGRWQVSTAGGSAPRWSHDARELYYLSTETGGAALRLTLTAVPVQIGTTISFGPPSPIGPVSSGSRGYDVAPDGRFLINEPAASAVSSPARARIVVVRNWLEDVKGRLSR
jgi:eukaryotic-like serine/threonine-protein kinase